MVEGAKFCGEFDIPECPCTATEIPSDLSFYYDDKIPANFNGFAHFYKDDYKFDRIWRYARTSLKRLKRFAGIITPDFSTYQDMPVALKIYNTYRMRAFGYWLGTQGVKVINNVRWGTPESYQYCFDGIPQNSIVAVSTVGCIKTKDDERRFKDGLYVMIKRLNPSYILVYGKAGRDFFKKYMERGVQVKFYEQPDYHTFTTIETTTIMKARKFV